MPQVDKGTRPVHDDAVACPWRTPAWRTIKTEEQDERLSGRGTFVFGQRVPYHGEIVLPTQPVDGRRAAVDAFWHQVKRPVPPLSAQSSRVSTASSRAISARWSHIDRKQLLLKASTVSKHIDEAHNGLLKPGSATARSTHASLLSALLSPRASPYAIPHSLPMLGRTGMRQAVQVSGRQQRGLATAR